MPDGQAVVFWAFAQDSANWAVPGPLTVPGPQLNVVAGDSLVLHVTNTLPEPVSIVIPGQYGFDTEAPVFWTAGPYAGRVRSLNHEAPPANGVATYTWKNVQGGTCLYHSGSHPSVQVQMGLYGALAVLAPGPSVYGSNITFQATVLLSEVDTNVHAAVAAGSFGPGPAFLQTDFANPAALIAAIQASANPVAQFVAANITGVPASLASDLDAIIGAPNSIYDPGLFPDATLSATTLALMRPDPELNQDYPGTGAPFRANLVRLNRSLLYDGLAKAGINLPMINQMTSASRARAQYFMINGQPYTSGQPALVAGAAGGTTLVRLLNAGMDLRTPTLNNGGDLVLVGEDAQPAPYPRHSAVVLLPALKTVDALWTPAAAGNYAIYERHLGLVSGLNMFGGALTFLSAGAPVASSAPAILIPPASQTVPEFSTATFGVVAGGSGLTYQWQSNGVPIAGATAPYYSLANVKRTNTGALFRVVVSGTGGSPVTSAAASLTVVPAGPTIVTQPAGITLPPAPASLWVVPGGSTPFSYQWSIGPTAAGPFTPITGATASNLVFATASPANGGWYQVVVTGPVVSAPGVFVAGAGASVASIPVEVKISPVIVTEPRNNLTVPDLGSATFSVVATGTGLAYQWYRNDTGAIAGATAASYTIAVVHRTLDDGVGFYVVVSGDTGQQVTSSSTTLRVTAIFNSVAILSQPASIATNAPVPGVAFTVLVDAVNPSYAWYRWDGASWVLLKNNLNNAGGAFLGVNSPTLTVRGVNGTPVNVGQAGIYQVRVTSGGKTVRSADATLTVTQTFVGAPVRNIPVGGETPGGTSTPYPARTASVPALMGSSIQHASVTLTLTDPEPFDADILIAAPGGAKSVQFMAGVGPVPAPGVELPPIGPKYYFYGVTNCVLTFDDAAAAQISTNYWLAAGTYQPTVFPMGTNWMTLPLVSFPPAVNPAGIGNTFSTLTGYAPPAGAWGLYVNDNASDLAIQLPADQTVGTIPHWSLTLTAGPAPGPLPAVIATEPPALPPEKVAALQPGAAGQ